MDTNRHVKWSKEALDFFESDGGKYYLSIKSPMVIDGEIEGIIGLAINITDRKKAQKLEQQNNLKIIYEQIAHDIRSPLAALSMFTKNCKGLSEKEHIALRNIATSIESITSDLLNKYKENKEIEYVEPADIRFSEQYISIYISLLEILNNKRCQYRDFVVTFNFSYDPSSIFAFIRGDYSNFCRMTSNIINNSVEAGGFDSGNIRVISVPTFSVDLIDICPFICSSVFLICCIPIPYPSCLVVPTGIFCINLSTISWGILSIIFYTNFDFLAFGCKRYFYNPWSAFKSFN